MKYVNPFKLSNRVFFSDKKFDLFHKVFIIITLSFLTFIISPLNAKAKEFTNNETIVDIKLINGPNFYPSSTINFNVEFDLSNKEVEPGDILNISIPEGLLIPKDTHIEFKDDNGNILAIGQEKDGKIAIIFTEKVLGKENIHGFLNLGLKIQPDILPLGKNILEFEINSGTVPIEINIEERIEDLSKKGKILELPDGRKAIKWTIIANRNEISMNNLVLTDTIIDNKLIYTPEGLQVYTGQWSDVKKTSYKRKKLLSRGIDYQIAEDQSDVTINFSNGNQMYIIDLFTVIKDPKSIETIGETFKNNAIISWIDDNGKKQQVKLLLE